MSFDLINVSTRPQCVGHGITATVFSGLAHRLPSQGLGDGVDTICLGNWTRAGASDERSGCCRHRACAVTAVIFGGPVFAFLCVGGIS